MPPKSPMELSINRPDLYDQVWLNQVGERKDFVSASKAFFTLQINTLFFSTHEYSHAKKKNKKKSEGPTYINYASIEFIYNINIYCYPSHITTSVAMNRKIRNNRMAIHGSALRNLATRFLSHTVLLLFFYVQVIDILDRIRHETQPNKHLDSLDDIRASVRGYIRDGFFLV